MPDHSPSLLVGQSEHACKAHANVQTGEFCPICLMAESTTALRMSRERAEAAEAHLWALVVHFGGTYDNPYVQRDMAAAAAYVNGLADEDMSARHRAVLAANPTKQPPPNENWCVGCTPDPDIAPGIVCPGCPPSEAENA